jgi:hypothetical protein
MDISTKYLVPRSRAGLARQGYQPLVAAGRDIHGLVRHAASPRRSRVQYIYDNEEVFNVEDRDRCRRARRHLDLPQLVMVPRIKIAAESIRPRPFAFTRSRRRPPRPEPPRSRSGGVRVIGRVDQPARSRNSGRRSTP